MPSSARRAVVAAGFAAALAIRLALLLRYPGNFDTESYRLVAGIVERGGDPYRGTERYNYSPLWAFVVAGVDRAASALGIRFVLANGLLLLAVDGATALLLYRLGRRRAPRFAGASAALLFFANPVSVAISSRHGQFDGAAILLLLGAVALAERARDGAAAAALAASLLVKHVAWFHPLLFPRRPGWRGALLLLAPYAAFLASFLPYAGSADRIATQVFRHRGLADNYGIEAIRLLPFAPVWAPDAVFVAAVLAAAFLLRRVELPRACLRLFLVVLIFLPGSGAQFGVWPIALGALFPGPGYLLYTVVTAGFLARAVLGLDRLFPHLPGWYGPWWAAIAWLLFELRADRRTPAPSGLRSRGAHA